MGTASKKTLIIIFSLTLLGPLAIDLFLPSFPEMINYFQVSEKEIHLTVSVYIIFLGLGQLLVGNFSDRKGRQASALLGTAFYFTGSIIGATSEHFYLLLIGRALEGIGAASCSVSSMAWVRENFSQKESVKWLSYMIGTVGIVPAFAPSLGSFIAEQFNWQTTFGFKALLAAFIFVGVYFLIPKGIKVFHEENTKEQKDNCTYKSIFTNRLFRRYNFTSTIGMAALLTYISNAPIVAIQYGKLSSYQFSLAFGIIGIIQVLANFISPKISQRWGQEKTIIGGILIIIFGGLNFFHLHKESTIEFFIFSAISMTGVSLIIGPSLALTLSDFKMCAGKATSIDGFNRMAGGAIIAAAINLNNWDAVTSTGIAFLLFGTPLAFNLIKRIK